MVVPELSGVTVPVDDPIVATDVLLLDHVPLAVAHVNVVAAAPSHTDRVPAIDAGLALTVAALFL